MNRQVVLLAALLLAAIAGALFLFRRARRSRGESPRWIEIEDLERGWPEHGTTVVDVRGRDEFDGPLGHIAGAVNLPLDALPGRLPEIEASGEGRVVLVCRTDRRSASAAVVLRAAGFRDVRVLRGGMEAWNRAGRPVERDAPPGREPPAAETR